ncbi:MAG: hypothetical protein QXN26_06295 [Thermoplasmataceae archaeon]
MEGRGQDRNRRVMWYGYPRPRGFAVFSNIEREYSRIFDDLRDGKVPESEAVDRADLPDLRSLMIEYAKYRVKNEFREDQYVRKFYSLVPEINKSINLILEKVMTFGLITGVSYNSDDPCRFFTSLEALDLPEEISSMVTQISSSVTGLCALRSSLIQFLSERVRTLMPNTCRIAGEDLATELLFHAGSLRNLAMMPASSIQVLGAEKALFKHFVSGTPPPKHGILFHYRGLSSLPARRRGRAARVIAGKIAIASRADLSGTLLDTDKMLGQIKEIMNRK